MLHDLFSFTNKVFPNVRESSPANVSARTDTSRAVVAKKKDLWLVTMHYFLLIFAQLFCYFGTHLLRIFGTRI